MVVITQKRFKGQDGRPTHPKLLGLLTKGTPLEKIPHQYFFPEVVLKNLINVKKTVLKNKEAYIRSGGGNKMTSSVMIVDGYCQPKGSKVLMSNGDWKNIEEIKIGDEVISPNKEGGHTFEKVIKLHNHFEEEVYEVWEKNRLKRKLYSCSANHMMPIYRQKGKRITKTKTEQKEVFEIRKAREIAKYKIPIISFTTPEINFNIEGDKLKLPAYDLGVWLGDGSYTTTHLVRISSPNEEIIKSLSEKYLSYCNKVNANCKDYSFSKKSNLANQLRRLGLYNKRSGEKFIPREYLVASIKDRWELLAGLIDTDGYMTWNKSIEYSTKSEQLAKDIQYLVHSLGGRVTLKRRDFVLKTGIKTHIYRFNIQFTNHNKLPLKCTHKKKGKKNRKARGDAKRIKIELKKGKPSQVYGFSITGESKFYITDNWMVTHNSGSGKSTVASQIALFFDPTMTLERNYAWNMERLMKLIENSYPGQVIILDEGMVFNSRKANSQDNIKLIVALSQVRSKGIFFIICINSVHQLEKSIPLSRADFLVHVKRIGGMTGTPKYCVYDADRMKQLIVKNAGRYSYAGVYPNVDWSTFSKYFPFEDVRYDKMKHKESLKNIQDPKKKEKDIKVKLGLARLVEHCKQEYGLSYAQSGKIAKVPSTSIENYRVLLHEQGEEEK